MYAFLFLHVSITPVSERFKSLRMQIKTEAIQNYHRRSITILLRTTLQFRAIINP